jgi:hypothetical protein
MHDPLMPFPPLPIYYPEYLDDPTMLLEEETTMGIYHVRRWCTPPSDDLSEKPFANCVVTIDGEGKPRIEIGSVHEIDDLSGQDVTGEGDPDLILSTGPVMGDVFPATIVYNLGDEPIEVLNTMNSRCHTQFEDLDGDGNREGIGCDSPLVYMYCSALFTDQANARVIYRYEAGQGYVPANLQFVDQYEQEIAFQTEIAKNATPGGFGEYDGTTKCGVLGLVLAYLYSGQTEEAWAALHRYYDYADVEAFAAEIEKRVFNSPLFVYSGSSE